MSVKRIFAACIYWGLTLAFWVPVLCLAGLLALIVYDQFYKMATAAFYTVLVIGATILLVRLHFWAKENK